MDLAPEQYFVYAWRYTDDTVCKLGVSTLRTFYARIKAAKTVTYQDIELLGIEVFGTEAEARTAYRQRLKTLARVADRRAWVHFDAAVRQWLATECVSNPLPLMLSKMPFRMIPCAVKRSASINAGLRKNARRENAQRRNPVRNGLRRIGRMNGNMLESVGKMIRHIRRNRCSVRRYGERSTRVMIKIGMRLTRQYAESRKAARRERYATDPEYRALEKQRRREFAQDNPDYKEKRRVYMREYRKTEEGGRGRSLKQDLRDFRIFRIVCGTVVIV